MLTAGSEAGDVHSGAHLVVFGRRGAAWMQTVTVERRSERPGGVVRSTHRRRRERERERASCSRGFTLRWHSPNAIRMPIAL